MCIHPLSKIKMCTIHVYLLDSSNQIQTIYEQKYLMNIAMFHTLDTIETLGLCMFHFQLITEIVKCKSSYEDDIP